MRRVRCWGVLAGLALILARPGRAAADMGAVVRVATPLDAEVLQRVRGHVSDLAVVLAVEPGPLEAGLAAEVEAARSLAAAHGARVVVWFEARGGGLLVYVAEPGAGKVLVRRLEPESGPEARSAQLETAAVVVRSALRALAEGGQIGVAADALLGEAGAPAALVGVAVPVPLPGRHGLRWRASLGWQIVLDGQSPHGEQALAAHMGAEWGRFGLALVADAGLPSRLRDARSAVDLARHSAGLSATVGVARGPGYALAASVDAAGGAYFRSTVESSAGVVATPARVTPIGLLGAGLRAELTRGPLGLELLAGADAVLGAPELVYDTGGTAQLRNRLWVVQPRVTISLLVRMP